MLRPRAWEGGGTGPVTAHQVRRVVESTSSRLHKLSHWLCRRGACMGEGGRQEDLS
jgi:hypothetical protein